MLVSISDIVKRIKEKEGISKKKKIYFDIVIPSLGENLDASMFPKGDEDFIEDIKEAHVAILASGVRISDDFYFTDDSPVSGAYNIITINASKKVKKKGRHIIEYDKSINYHVHYREVDNFDDTEEFLEKAKNK